MSPRRTHPQSEIRNLKPEISMTEQTIWTGTSSQVKNFWLFVACLLVIPIPWAIWAWLKTKNRTYTLTSERLMIRSGVFNIATETLELYRVRDLQMMEPFWLRLWGLKNLHLITTDSTRTTSSSCRKTRDFRCRISDFRLNVAMPHAFQSEI